MTRTELQEMIEPLKSDLVIIKLEIVNIKSAISNLKSDIKWFIFIAFILFTLVVSVINLLFIH